MNITPSIYFSGQGVVSAAIRDVNGVPQGFIELGNVPSLTIKPGSAGVRFATANPIGPIPFGLPSGDPPSFSIQVEDVRKTNLQRLLLASDTEVAAGTVTSEAGIGFQGRQTAFAHINLTGITSVKNAAGTVTYMPGVDYESDFAGGSIKPIVGGAIADGTAIASTYTHAAYSRFNPFTQAPSDVWIRLAGLNTSSNNKPCVVDIFQSTLPILDKLDLINDEILSFGFDGVMKLDKTQPGSALYFAIRMMQ